MRTSQVRIAGPTLRPEDLAALAALRGFDPEICQLQVLLER